jgi:hypothetical protein
MTAIIQAGQTYGASSPLLFNDVGRFRAELPYQARWHSDLIIHIEGEVYDWGDVSYSGTPSVTLADKDEYDLSYEFISSDKGTVFEITDGGKEYTVRGKMVLEVGASGSADSITSVPCFGGGVTTAYLSSWVNRFNQQWTLSAAVVIKVNKLDDDNSGVVLITLRPDQPNAVDQDQLANWKMATISDCATLAEMSSSNPAVVTVSLPETTYSVSVRNKSVDEKDLSVSDTILTGIYMSPLFAAADGSNRTHIAHITLTLP